MPSCECDFSCYLFCVILIFLKKMKQFKSYIPYNLSPVLTSDTSMSINISIRSLCASEDSRNMSISISFFLMLMLMLMLMFSEDIVDISISAL